MDIIKFSKEQLTYCNFVCEKGCKMKKHLLKDCESTYDAAFDMWCFIEHCSENCNVMKGWSNTDARNN